MVRPPLSHTKKKGGKRYFGGDANPGNNHRVRTGLWDLREWYIIRNLPESSAVYPDKQRAAWAFEWKVIPRHACHRWQRAASTCNHCPLQQESLQIHLRGVFSLVASAFKAEGMSEPPHGEAEILRGLWWRWRLSFGVVVGFPFPHRLHHARLPDAAAAGPTATLDVHFGCPMFCNSMNSRIKSGWGAFHCPSSSLWRHECVKYTLILCCLFLQARLPRLHWTLPVVLLGCFCLFFFKTTGFSGMFHMFFLEWCEDKKKIQFSSIVFIYTVWRLLRSILSLGALEKSSKKSWKRGDKMEIFHLFVNKCNKCKNKCSIYCDIRILFRTLTILPFC